MNENQNTSIVSFDLVDQARGSVFDACLTYASAKTYGQPEALAAELKRLRAAIDRALAVVEPPIPESAVRYRVRSTRELIQALTPDEFARLRAAGVITTSPSNGSRADAGSAR